MITEYKLITEFDKDGSIVEKNIPKRIPIEDIYLGLSRLHHNTLVACPKVGRLESSIEIEEDLPVYLSKTRFSKIC